MHDRNFRLSFAIIVSAICGGISYGSLLLDATVNVAWSWGLLAMIFAGVSVWILFHKEAAPDIPWETGLNPFVREGLCFSFLPSVKNGELNLTVVFQNLHKNPCTAEIIIKPTSSAEDCNISTLRLKLECRGGGTGVLSVPWLVDSPRPGKAIECLIGADVEYPTGRGVVVHSREGAPVGSIESASTNESAHSIQSTARFRFLLPAGIRESASHNSTQ